jgi:hypothetical protein
VQVEELRQQIRVLQAVGYGSMDIEEAAPSTPGASREGAGPVGSLENLLLSKARRLEHELTMSRLRLSEVAGSNPCAAPRSFHAPRLPQRKIQRMMARYHVLKEEICSDEHGIALLPRPR